MRLSGPKTGKAVDGGPLDHAGFGGYSIGPGPSKADEWSNGRGNIAVNIGSYLKSGPDIILLRIGTNEFFTIGKLAGFATPDWSGDGPHPSESGYRKLAGVWFGALKDHLTADPTLKAGYVAARAKAEQQLAKQQQQQIAEAAALSNRVRGPVTPIADFVKQKPSYAYQSWDPLAGSGSSSADGWTVRALPDGGMGVIFPQPIDLSLATHLVVLIRGEEGGNCDVYIKLNCAEGERMFKVDAASITREMKELLLPVANSEGAGNLALVKQVQIQGNFNRSQKFAYTLKRLEAEMIHPVQLP